MNATTSPSPKRIAAYTLTFLAGLLIVAGCQNNDSSSTSHQAQADNKQDRKVSTTHRKPQASSGENSAHPKTQSQSNQSDNSSKKKANDPAPQSSSRSSQSSDPQPIYRPPDTRPDHDDQKLARLGIHNYESKRLKLYTDIDPEIARTLPPVIDQAYKALVEYFGPLPPDRQGKEYQITAYIMDDKPLFKKTGLLPEDLPGFFHGRHRGAEFWMNEQEFDYYRQHLMIHEATHCFMTTMPGVTAPVWYMEGMAELFGTHTVDDEGRVRFRVMPYNKNDFGGFGRITMIQDTLRQGHYLSLRDITQLEPNDFLKNETYAWSWALCHFLDQHPRYQQAFRELGKHINDGQFASKLQEAFTPHLHALWTEWPLFVRNLQPGYQIQQAAIDFQPGKPLPLDGKSPHTTTIAADRGWQSSRLLVEKGQTYRITASGKFQLAQKPKPWISKPQGISFRYFDGQPLGKLLAAVRTHPVETEADAATMLTSFPIGREQQFTPETTGTLYFRVNDSWSELSDNSGTLTIQIERADK